MSRWPGVFTTLALVIFGCLVGGVILHHTIRARYLDSETDGVDGLLLQADQLIMGVLLLIGGLCLAALIGCVVHLRQKDIGDVVMGGRRREAELSQTPRP